MTIDETTYLAMKLLVLHIKMRRFCLDRSTCNGCPFRPGLICQRQSTETVINKVVSVFEPTLSEMDEEKGLSFLRQSFPFIDS